MKKLLIACVALFGTTAWVSAQKIEFKTLEINYGKIGQGADGARDFEFTNTGSAPLVIENAQGSCGCTVPEYPKEPIMPGAKGKIRVKYDTQRLGGFTKYVTLKSNSTDNPETRLTISGEVLTEAPAAAPVPAPITSQTIGTKTDAKTEKPAPTKTKTKTKTPSKPKEKTSDKEK